MGIKKDTQPEMLPGMNSIPSGSGIAPIDLGKRWNHQNFKIMFPLTKTHLRREKWGLGRRYSLLRADDHVVFLKTRHDFGLMAMKGNISERILPLPFRNKLGYM